MYQKILIVLLLFLALTQKLIAGDGNQYGQTIYTDKVEGVEFKQSLADLVQYLQKITGHPFQVKEEDGQPQKGIYLLFNRDGLLPHELEQKLNSGTVEDFVLSGNNNRLLMVATHPSGFTRAIYTYLDQLGVKWYFPGEDWEYVKPASEISYAGSRFYTPSFTLRDFFGTGGIRHVVPLDADKSLEKKWEEWKRRNRMGGSLALSGHYGEWFNQQHKAELQQHPEYFAMNNGKRVPWSESAKWCISNKDFRKMFVADRVQELKQALANRKYATEKIILTVDPADGGGDCECDNCRKLGSVSDRVFLLANEVAKAFSKISPYAYANLYAYNKHATPVSFSLEPNLIVQIIPYAFQTFGTPEEMIRAWQKRNSSLLIYDYFSIPDWHYDIPLPRKTSSDSLVKKISYWYKEGIKGFVLESDYSSGIAGFGLYQMARMGWDMSTDVNALKKEFLQNMFGGASQQVGSYYQWIANQYKGAADLPYLFKLLNEAQRTAGTGTHHRIFQLQAYLHYLLLYNQWQSANENDKKKDWEELMTFIWKLYPTGILHSTRIADLFLYKLNAADPLVKDWNTAEPYGAKLRQIEFINDREISLIAQKEAKDHPLLEDFVYERKTKRANFQLGKGSKTSDVLMIKEFPETYIRASTGDSFHFSVALNNEPSIKNYIAPIKISCIDTATRAVIYSKTEQVGYAMKTIAVPLPKGRTLRLVLEFTPWILFQVPAGEWIGFGNIPTYANMHILWFYVPAGTRYIYFTNMCSNQPVFADPAGKKVDAEKVNDLNMYHLDVSRGSGQWWSIPDSQYRILQFFSKPDLFFLHPVYSVRP